MPDYQAIVESWAGKLGATIVDIEDDEAVLGFPALAEHVLELLIQGFPIWMAASSEVTTRQLFIGLPVEDELGCVTAMHELGHIATTTPYEAQSVDVEARATQWALEHLPFTPSPLAAQYLDTALLSYEADPDLEGTAGETTQAAHRELQSLYHMLDPEWAAAHAAHLARLRTVSNQYAQGDLDDEGYGVRPYDEVEHFLSTKDIGLGRSVEEDPRAHLAHALRNEAQFHREEASAPNIEHPERQLGFADGLVRAAKLIEGSDNLFV